MKLPQGLWIPEQTATLAPIFVARNITTSSPAASLSIQTSQVPAQYLFAVGHTSVRAVPGAAQNVVAAQLDVHDRATTPAVVMLWYREAIGAIAARPFGWDDDRWTWIMPGHLLSLAIDFSAGAAANEARLAFSGWLIPRGNAQFGGF